MIKTTKEVLYDVINQKKATIYAHITYVGMDYENEVNELRIEEFIVVDGEKMPLLHNGMPYRHYTLSFEQEDQIRAMVKASTDGLTARQMVKAVLAQGHLYKNNTDKVYGAKWEICDNPLPPTTIKEDEGVEATIG